MPRSAFFRILLQPVCLLFALFVFGENKLLAQSFRYKAKVAGAETNGYYKILLPTEIPGLAMPGLRDVRLRDNEGKTAPYLLEKVTAATRQREFVKLPITSQKHKPGCCTDLIVANPDRMPLNGLHLRIGNADVQKSIELSGSDDGQNWYVVKARSVINTILNTTGTSELQLLGFPLNEYAYFRFTISDSGSAPLRILEAGYYTNVAAGTTPWERLTIPEVFRADTAKAFTWLLLTWQQPQLIERLTFRVQGQPLFFRNAGVMKQFSQYRSKRRNWHQIQGFSLSPSDTVLLFHEGLQTDSIWLRIDNQDNPALDFVSITAWQQPRHLAAYLETGKEYSILFGNDSIPAPSYDLARFADQLPEDLPVIRAGKTETVSATGSGNKKPEGSKTWWESKLVLWLALALIAAFMAYMVRMLLREMHQNKP